MLRDPRLITLPVRGGESPAPAAGLEFSIHAPDARFLRQFGEVFPDAPTSGVLVVPVFQPCVLDLVAIGPEAEAEKNLCLARFLDWATPVCHTLRSRGHWADIADPCSGLPLLGTRGSSFYPDVIGAQRLLKYDLLDTGCCKLIAHPSWGTKVYPSTLFAACPVDVLEEVLLLPPPPH